MRLPGIEYGPVQSLGREQVNRNYLATASAKAAGITKIVDATGKIAEAIDQRVIERQYQKAVTAYAEKSAEVKLELEEQQGFTAKFLRGEGLDVQGEDDAEYPAYEVAPYLYNRRMDKALDDAAGLIYQGAARAKFRASRAERHENSKQIYSLEQMTRYKAAMTAELDSDNARLMAVGQHYDAIEKVEASSLPAEEKTKRIHAIHQDRQITEINWTKNDPDATVKDLKKLYTQVHGREFNHVTKGQRDQILRDIKFRIKEIQEEEKEALSTKEARELVDRYLVPDGDPVALDKILRDKASTPEALQKARIEVGYRTQQKKAQEKQTTDAAWERVHKEQDPKIIDSLPVKPSVKTNMRVALRKIQEGKYEDEPELIFALKRLAAGQEVEIDGKAYKPEDFATIPLEPFRSRLSRASFAAVDNAQVVTIKNKNNPEKTATATWQTIKDKAYARMLGKQKTQWTNDDKLFFYDIDTLIDNQLGAAEAEKGSKLTSQEMDALVREALRERRYTHKKYSMFKGMTTREVSIKLKELAGSGELARIMKAMEKAGLPTSMMTPDRVMQGYYELNDFTDAEPKKKKGAGSNTQGAGE